MVEEDDWKRELKVQPGWTDDRYMFNPGSHHPSKLLRLDSLQRGRGHGLTWGMAGQMANDRSLAAFFALLADAEHDFVNVKCFWMGCLMKKVGLTVQSKDGQEHYMCLGFQDYAFALWPLTLVESNQSDNCYLELTSEGVLPLPFQFSVLASIDPFDCPYYGTPTRVTVPAELPPDLQQRGIMLHIDGPAETDLLKHAVTNTSYSSFSKEELKNICLCRPDISKDTATSGDSKKAYWTRIVNRFFEEGDPEHSRLLEMIQEKETIGAKPDSVLHKSWTLRVSTLEPRESLRWEEIDLGRTSPTKMRTEDASSLRGRIFSSESLFVSRSGHLVPLSGLSL